MCTIINSMISYYLKNIFLTSTHSTKLENSRLAVSFLYKQIYLVLFAYIYLMPSYYLIETWEKTTYITKVLITT